MNSLKFAKKFALPLFVALAYGPAQALAAPILGADLDSFAVFGTAGVSTDPTSTITRGDRGTVTANASTGTYNLLSGSQKQLITSSALRAFDDLGPVPGTPGIGSLPDSQTAWGTIGLSTDTTSIQNIKGTYIAGVYNFGAGFLNSGDKITLDAQNTSNAVWTFRFSTTLTANQGSLFEMINVAGDGSGLGLYWSTGTSATLNADKWAGNVLAKTTITSDGGLTMTCGRLLAGTAVTLIGDSISTACARFTSNGFDQMAAPVPEPETYAMLLAGLGLMGFVARRRQRNLAAAA